MALEIKYFVLNPTSKNQAHARASTVAMDAYAKAIYHTDPQRALDIWKWIGGEIERG